MSKLANDHNIKSKSTNVHFYYIILYSRDNKIM